MADDAKTAGGFPPYPPYVVEPAPASVADTIIAGRDLRLQHKSVARRPVFPPPKPAKPKGPKATDVKLPRRALRAHARCLKRHGTVLTDRLERISKPRRRTIIYLWREHAQMFPPETIARLRSTLDADEPFKPDQAYEYFINLRKSKKKNTATSRVNEIKKDILSMYGDRRFLWARNATVAFARGIQQRLSRSGRYALADGMLRLSNIILGEICGNMHMRTPSRRSTHPKAKFMMEMADKIAVWIDEILSESDDRMLMMDFDEDEDILGQGGAFADNFLDMMGDGGAGGGPRRLLEKPPAYKKFKGPMLDAFLLLTGCMEKKGDAKLVSHGKFEQTYSEGAKELKTTTDLNATEFNSTLACQINKDLTEVSKAETSAALEPFMKEIVDICSKYLSQFAEYNKDKGPAFKLLVSNMRKKGGEELYKKDKLTKSYGAGAEQLMVAKGLENDHDDPNLSQELHSKLTKVVESVTPENLKKDMTETVDISSKYLSQAAVDEIERGPAFDLLIAELERDGAVHFSDFPAIATRYSCAYKLKTAPGLTSVTPDPATAPQFAKSLHMVVDPATSEELKPDMDAVIERCAGYLSAFVRDRDIVMKKILEMMKSKPKNIFASRPNYTMDYATGAKETEEAPALIPYLPIKDVADEGKANLTRDMEGLTPPELKVIMKVMISDVAKHLSQPFALRSGVAGERYALEFLSKVKQAIGARSLFKYKQYGQSYADAANTLMHAGPLEIDERSSTTDLHFQIKSEMTRGVPQQLAPTIAVDLHTTMDKASRHLANVGTDKGDTMEHLVEMMKEKGETPLAQLQGYEQTYTDAARRIDLAPSLANETIDKPAYETVKGKLTTMADDKKDKLPEKHAELMPEVIDESSKFLSAPEPETPSEKRQVLADLMGRAGEKIVGQEGIYKMTHIEGGQEIKQAPVGVTTAKDEKKNKEILEKVHAVIPDEKMKTLLKDPAQEGAAHLADTIKGRGDALEVIHEAIKKEKEKEFLTVGDFSKTHEQTATMLEDAPHFTTDRPSPILYDVVEKKVKITLPENMPAHLEDRHYADAQKIASKYIAGRATKESGLDAKALAGMEAKLNKKGKHAGSGESEEERLRRLEAERRRKKGAGESDAEHQAMLAILIQQLKTRGGEVFYEQPHIVLTHNLAADWLSQPPMPVEKAVKESGDTARLHKKFEKKLGNLVSPVTPADMIDIMQDVVIESARNLSEAFVGKNYKAQAKDALISEMQKRRNEILIEVDGAAETSFFAAQRLKKAKDLKTTEPCAREAPRISKKLDEIMRYHSMPRKLTPSVKEHTKEAANYLSALVTKPNEEIEAYIALLEEMENAGDTVLVEGENPKSHKESADYLRTLTTFDDQINRPNPTLQSGIVSKLTSLMAGVTPSGYSPQAMNAVITESAGLLSSYAMLQGEKTEALRVLVQKMEEAGNNMLLRHGNVRKAFKDGADLLRGKHADQLAVWKADPVVARKIEIKIHNLMFDKIPDKFQSIMQDVISDATMYLAVHLLEPQIIKVCKCMKNVFVQCELWCEEILRRVAKPSCTCSRHVSVQDISDLAPTQYLRICPGSSRVFAPGVEIAVTECRSKHRDQDCQAPKPSTGCINERTPPTSTYLLHSTAYGLYGSDRPTRIGFQSSSDTSISPLSESLSTCKSNSDRSSTVQSLLMDIHSQNMQFLKKHEHSLRLEKVSDSQGTLTTGHPSLIGTFRSRMAPRGRHSAPFKQNMMTMFAKIQTRDTQMSPRSSPDSPDTGVSKKFALEKSCYSSRTPISMDQMADWHAMMVSLTWNVQAWRKWIQENIDRGLNYQYDPKAPSAETEDSLIAFQRRVSTEALQWRQYNIFSRQLTLRLVDRYSDKEIVSPTRATIKTGNYTKCAREMLDMIDMFNRWTQWLILVVKETASLQQPSNCNIPLHAVRWNHYKKRMIEYSKDWIKYNLHLKVCWEEKYRTFISECVPYMTESGPVWVVSACGAVPSGAVAAGIYDGEVIWIARTTHRSHVLPAALQPSKHCCLVYTDGAVHYYTKYQVMCNAEVNWVAWRSGAVGARAVRAAEGVYIGRVHYRGSHLVGPVYAPHYRCQVVIFGRPFAFSCYELLVLADQPTQ